MLTAMSEVIMGSEKRNRGKLLVDPEGDWQQIVRILPKGHKAVGVVRQGNEAPGVLAFVESSGEYVQLNAEGTRTLDQRKVRAALGLPNPVGKPRMSYEVRQPYTVRLEPSLAVYFEEVGGGSLAAGITKVGNEHRERAERKGVNRLADVLTGK